MPNQGDQHRRCLCQRATGRFGLLRFRKVPPRVREVPRRMDKRRTARTEKNTPTVAKLMATFLKWAETNVDGSCGFLTPKDGFAAPNGVRRLDVFVFFCACTEHQRFPPILPNRHCFGKIGKISLGLPPKFYRLGR